MAPGQNSTVVKRTYTAPTIARMPIGATAAANLQNSDAAVFQADTAFGPPSGS